MDISGIHWKQGESSTRCSSVIISFFPSTCTRIYVEASLRIYTRTYALPPPPPPPLLQYMADYRNPDISNLPHFPTLSDDPSLEQFYNSLDGPLISPSPEFCVSNSNPGLNIGQDQGQGDSIADFLIDIVEDFSRDWDCVDVEANQKEERRARKRIMDKRRQTRLNRGFAVLRSLLPKIGNTKVTCGN